jgi:hypothetical protein
MNWTQTFKWIERTLILLVALGLFSALMQISETLRLFNENFVQAVKNYFEFWTEEEEEEEEIAEEKTTA